MTKRNAKKQEKQGLFKRKVIKVFF